MNELQKELQARHCPDAQKEVPVQGSLVDHPEHYNQHPSGIECIDVVEHMSFNIGSAIKYLWREGLKPGENSARDLKKALWCINREIDRRSGDS